MAGRAHRNGLKACGNDARPDPALGGSTPAEGRYPLIGEPTLIFGVRAKILLLLAVGAARLQSRCGCCDEVWVSARPCIARASRGGAHGRAWVRVRANCPAVQGSWCAHAAVDHRELLEIDGDGRRTERFFRPFGRELGCLNSHFLGKPLLGVV